jgi:hypothetical protein
MAYPGSLDTFTTKVDFVDTVLAAHMNAVQTAAAAIEGELGTNPKAITDTVTPGSTPASVAEYLDMAAAQLRLAIGGANWYTAPSISLATLAARTITAGAGLTGGGTLAADRTIALDTPGTLTDATSNTATGNHTHAVTASAAPGAAASLLKTTAAGALTLASLSLGALTMTGNIGGTSFSINPSATLTLAPADLVLDPSNNAVTPATTTDVALGSPTKRWSAVYAANLTVDSLVPISTAVSMGGRLLIGISTKLIADCAPAASTIDVALNVITNGDVLYLEQGGKSEWMLVTSGATGITGGYRYSVTRAHGTGTAQQWYTGDLVFDTGQAGSGWIDLYAQTAIKSATEAGPTIALNVRASTTYNDWGPRAAIGNLKGLYGLTANAYGIGAGSYSGGKYLLYDGSKLTMRGDLVVGPGINYGSAALLHCRFDGPLSTADYQIDTSGHAGQKATATSTVLGRLGKFGKALWTSTTTTNLCTNPSAETGTTNLVAVGTGTTVTQITTDAKFGSACIEVAAADVVGGGVRINSTNRITVTAGTTYTFSLYLKRISSGANTVTIGVQYFDAAVNPLAATTTTAALTTDWARCMLSGAAPTGATSCYLYVARSTSGAHTYRVDGMLFEAAASASGYADGSMPGCTWSGTGHASTSTRGTASYLTYPISNVKAAAGTIAMWVRLDALNPNGGALWQAGDANAEHDAYITSGGVVAYRTNGTSLTGATLSTGTWYHVVFTWDVSADTRAIYVNGAQSGSTGTVGATPSLHATAFGVGYSPHIGASYVHIGLIDDLAVYDRAMTSDEVAAMYGDGATPLAETTSTAALMLTGPGAGRVIGHAGGIFATNAAGAPTWSLLNEDTTINSEALGEGDVLLGDNSASKANLLWDKSAGKLLFRGGTTMQVEIDTDGTLLAGAGKVKLNSSGITVDNSGSTTGYVRFTDGATLLGSLHAYKVSGPPNVTEMQVYSKGNADDDRSRVRVMVQTGAATNASLDIDGENGRVYTDLDIITTEGLSIGGDVINVATQKTPASAGAAGTKGDICHDASYVYVCTATNTWKRAAIATW